jgi:hypothetical protein
LLISQVQQKGIEEKASYKKDWTIAEGIKILEYPSWEKSF